MFQQPGAELQRAPLHMYNTVIKVDATTPASWRTSVIPVTPKSGDLALPQNYRPICTVSIPDYSHFWTDNNLTSKL
eukprot:8198086-Pyramimonas_sp.AAC.1